jgi:hypothetical protein
MQHRALGLKLRGHFLYYGVIGNVVVLTDGEIEYPEEEMPYHVLWLLPADGSSSFHPPYGVVLTMQPS